MNGDLSPREKAKDLASKKSADDRISPRSDASSHGSSTSTKHRDSIPNEKASTPFPSQPPQQVLETLPQGPPAVAEGPSSQELTLLYATQSCMPADIPTSYSNGIGALHNNISPNNIAFNHRNLFQGDPHANPAHAAHIRPALGNSAGGKPAYSFHVSVDGQMQPVPFLRML